MIAVYMLAGIGGLSVVCFVGFLALFALVFPEEAASPDINPASRRAQRALKKLNREAEQLVKDQA